MKNNKKTILNKRDNIGRFIGLNTEDNYNWKGDNVGYNALHEWIKNHKQKSNVCEHCKKKKRLELANISGNYYRRIDDYKWLCHSCHQKYDFIKRKIKRDKFGRFKKNGKRSEKIAIRFKARSGVVRQVLRGSAE
jgi:hypothetical protein